MDVCEKLKYAMTASIPCLVLILFILIIKSNTPSIYYGHNPIPQIGKYQGLREFQLDSISPQQRQIPITFNTTRYP